MNLGMTLILTALMATAPQPSPSASPGADPCSGPGGHTAVLAALDRPTVGFSPCALKPGETLLEAGYQHSSGSAPFAQLGQGFLRFGVARNLEADAIGPSYVQQLAPPRASGFADPGAGLKWEFAHGASSAGALDVLLTVPAGSRAFTSGAPTQTVNVDYSASFGKFGFASTLGVVHAAGYDAVLPSVVASNQYNARTQLYLEAFGQSRTGVQTGGLFGFDGGAQYLLTPQLEVDAEFGHTASQSAGAPYVGFGFGVRL
ncbi:MAG: transporter [Candidatus Baltobacteraceae bacterium]